MTAPAPPNLEDNTPAESKHGIIDAFPSNQGDTAAGAPQENGGGPLDHATGPAGIKEEMSNGLNGHAAEGSEACEASETATTLRPAPQPSTKRRESEAGDAGPPELKERPDKKRKRAPSPPWHFPTAETSTIKTADGRRVSARFGTGTNTPIASESEGRVRSNSSRANSQSRPPSPPWKKFAAQGPTTIQVDGKRKSGRVNREANGTPQPKRVSPRTKKTVDKLAKEEQTPAPKSKAREKVTTDTPVRKPTRESARISRGTGDQARIEDLKARIAELEPSRSFDSPDVETVSTSRRRRGHGDATPRNTSPISQRKLRKASDASQSPETARPGLKLKLRRQSNCAPVAPPHPNAIPPSPPRPPRLNLYQVIESLELKEQQQPYSENERGPPSREEFAIRHQKAAEQEAVMRQKLLDAAQPGKPLSAEVCSIYRDDQITKEPPSQYGHQDHLASHALYLRHLQLKEKQNHRQIAKKLAYEALDHWKMKRGPTEEDLKAEADKMFKLIAKQVAFDMRAKWEMVQKYVDDRRRAQWEEEQEIKRQERLNKQLEWSQNMVARQRGEAGSDDDMSNAEEDSIGDVGSSEEDSSPDDEEDSEENMSDSASEAVSANEEEDEGDMDQDALAAYLAQRDASPQEPASETVDKLYEKEDDNASDDEDADIDKSRKPRQDPTDASATEPELSDSNVATPAAVQTDPGSPMEVATADQDADTEAADTPKESAQPASASAHVDPDQKSDDGLSSDESTDMDSEDYDSDEDMDDSDENSNEGSEDDDEQSESSEDPGHSNSLWALFSAKEKKALGLPTPVTSAEENNMDEDHEVEQMNTETGAQAKAMEEDTQAPSLEIRTADDKDVEMEDAVAGQPIEDDKSLRAPHSLLDTSTPGTPVSQSRSDTQGKVHVSQPALLRGDLRSYQQAGLEWLASLYRNKTNGILADEMGLGKTIQTISLLAYLAEQHGVWDTHLVIVPTSVLLNWVTEFQKFLPGFRVLGYYGTTEERSLKRRGWVNDPHHDQRERRGYNVVVTSYNIAIKDINALRNVKWHYMILDEAHNIRNFNSQRFQVLIRLRTKARLLLTGTPLQNSLTELWSLLTFLAAGAEDDAAHHGTLEEFLTNWKEPVKEIFDRGVQTLSDEASRVVGQLHMSLRPFMLRRLKSEVEKDLPKKREHTVVCKLSKRQRELYQDYMGLADTKAKLKQGNAVSAGRVLLSLRRVCNHPDLFDPRPIQTSFAMERSPLDQFAIKEKLVRLLLGEKLGTPHGLLIARNETLGKYRSRRSKQLSGAHHLRRQVAELEKGLGQAKHDLTTISGCQAFQRYRQREGRLTQIRDAITFTEATFSKAPVYGSDLREVLTVRGTRASLGCSVLGKLSMTTPNADARVGPAEFSLAERAFDRLQSSSTLVQRSIPTFERYGERFQDILTRFAFCTPEATAPILNYALPAKTQSLIRANLTYPFEADFAHEARVRNSIVFPDSRLLVYDSGKLQRLTVLLRELQAKSSRCLIFTQMTYALDILERFLNLLGLTYLRLDGSTTPERRQFITTEFNHPESKYQCMILSSRAGGVGLNLTGASSVIFFDLDWNPQMDKQCMDRAHRIGQVRDVDVFKMVSEKTVEENILRRANQKSLLDQAVIQEGRFTTDYNAAPKSKSQSEEPDDVSAAIDRFLSGGDKAIAKTIESVEDKEDVQAAQQARKEEQQDADEFADRSSKEPSVPPTPGATGPDEDDGDTANREGHVDGYMIKLVEESLKGVPFVPPKPERRLDKHGRDPSHRPKKRR